MQWVTANPGSGGELAGKTAIVTGSASGIGIGIARAFAEASMHVMRNDFGDNAEIERTRMELEESCHIKTANSAADKSRSAYVTAKHGLLDPTEPVALQAAEHGITVNAICPGYVPTPLVQKQIPETAKARGLTEEQAIKDVLLHAQPTLRFVTTDQVGALALFLCSDAGASMTGTALPVEGGWTAQ
jgi:NAD(P)-dependent dehydrogenase (short-subunit alcohol dehydrogenase family)